MHYVEGLLFDNHGLASRKATRKVVEQIKELKPDVIHIHCIHGYYLNYRILFEYLNSTHIPIVWTFHDCWAFTGHCAHFVTADCEKWKAGCYDCPRHGTYPKSFVDFSKRNYKLKKSLFTANNNLHVVPVSEWLARLTRESFLGGKDVRVIHNGVDISLFKPSGQVKNEKIRILGVSGWWTKTKGFEDFFRLRELLDRKKYEITMVGLSSDQVKSLPEGITGIEHTESVQELAALYATSDIFFNSTYADTFPTVNIEALACGTPVLTYCTGGSPEAVTPETGWVVEQGDLESVASIIKSLTLDQGVKKMRAACRERAVSIFDKDKCFKEYINLYEELTHYN